MSFSQENGYIPSTVADLMGLVRGGVNAQFGTTYDAETFEGTNFYKYFYALIQRLQENEVRTDEIVLKLQQYFEVTNEMITRPNTTNPGIIDYFTERDYVVSVKAPIDADAGKVYIAVDVDDGVHASGNITVTSYANLLTTTPDTVTVGATVFTAQSGAATLGTATFRAATSNDLTATSLAAQINAHAVAGALVKATAAAAVVTIKAIHGGTAGNAIALGYTDNGGGNIGATKSGTFLTGGTTNAAYAAARLAICTMIKDSIVAGVISQGTEVETITLSNSQSFDFKFNLPNRIPVILRLTLVTSANNQFQILTPQETAELLFTNIGARYRLGLSFEPQRYFSVIDAPWAASVLLEYSINAGGSWASTVYASNYDDLFTFALGDIEIIES